MTTALLIIDIQHGLFEPEPRPADAAAVIERAAALARAARAAGAPVVYIQHESGPAGRLPHGSAAWQLAPGLQPQADDTLLRKTTPDSFLRTELHERLQARGVRHVVLCGYASEFCVDTTARCAAALGYAVTLAADAHTTHDKAHASGAAIRAHENATLPAISSFGVPIRALASAAIVFAA